MMLARKLHVEKTRRKETLLKELGPKVKLKWY